MTYYIAQLRLWWWQMKREGAELERDRAAAQWHGANVEIDRVNARIEEVRGRMARQLYEVAG
jgi:hypothetical protein